MVTVGIKNLKNSLSLYMRLVKSGEKVLVTEHNRIIAEIIPALTEAAAEDHLSAYLAEESEQGKVERAERKVTIKIEKTADAADSEEIRKIYRDTRKDRD